jgi:hypothetical protein
MDGLVVGGRAVVVTGTPVRTARLRDEPYECLDEPHAFIDDLRRAGARVDLFTFAQEITEREPRYDFPREWDSVAALSVTTYADWWTRQINDKTRNMIRKARKRGVEVRSVELNDDLVRAIAAIYDERVIIQGKRNRHYRLDFETMKRAQMTLHERSRFIGAFHGDELIGFAKLLRGTSVASLASVISKTAHRDKAPTNALLDQAVQLCAEWGVPYLRFGSWSRRSLGEFKKHHAFEKVAVPRYFVPLTLRGRALLALGLHRRLSERLPDDWFLALTGMRDRWNAIRFRAGKA